MAIIATPAPLPLRNVSWRAPFPAQVNRSGWTGTSKVVGLPGATSWTLKAEFATIVGEGTGKKWRAFFMALRGSVNSFRVPATENRQLPAANPNVPAGAAVSAGNSLPLAGMPPNAPFLEAGDMLTVLLANGHERLVVLTQHLFADVQGRGTAVFQPSLTVAPAAATVEAIRPWALMRLTNEPPGWDVEPGQTYRFTINAEEAR